MDNFVKLLTILGRSKQPIKITTPGNMVIRADQWQPREILKIRVVAFKELVNGWHLESFHDGKNS